MGAIQQWAFALCTAMVACGLAQMLLPSSSMAKMFRITVSVFFLCCLLSPFVLRSPQLRIQVEDYAQGDIQRRAQQLTGLLEEQSREAIQAEVGKIVGDKLLEKGINYRSVTIHMETKGQNAGAEPVADIVLDKEYENRHESTRKALIDELGLEVRLGYE